MKLRSLTVGPIVGETTATRVRIWGRGESHIVEDMPQRCFGALRYKRAGDGAWSRTLIFKMNPNFDMTGIGVIERLSADSVYDYEIGHFYSEGELDDVQFSTSDWSKANRGTFRTAHTSNRAPRTLAIGSCRYLLKTFLGDFFDDRGDKTFRSINRLIENGTNIHQLIMMGDQIYADDLSALNPDKTVEQFYRRYRDAFSQKHIRQLMSQVPTYMTLDDHEIEDNWPSKASEKDWKTLFPSAIHAFQAYQLSHSPNIHIRRGRLEGAPKSLWYNYTDGCCDVFVTDSRTERYLDEPDNLEMLGASQLRALKRWLADESGRVKIIVTSVPFFPDTTSKENTDKWSGFKKQRAEILTHIENNSIRKVVFFSGDVHASFSAELISPTNIKLISVVSSAFFWPYPHPSSRHFQRRGTIDGGRAGSFKLTKVSRIIGDDNFSLVNVRPTGISVDVYSRKGNKKLSSEHQFN